MSLSTRDVFGGSPCLVSMRNIVKNRKKIKIIIINIITILHPDLSPKYLVISLRYFIKADYLQSWKFQKILKEDDDRHF